MSLAILLVELIKRYIFILANPLVVVAVVVVVVVVYLLQVKCFHNSLGVEDVQILKAVLRMDRSEYPLVLTDERHS